MLSRALRQTGVFATRARDRVRRECAGACSWRYAQQACLALQRVAAARIHGRGVKDARCSLPGRRCVRHLWRSSHGGESPDSCAARVDCTTCTRSPLKDNRLVPRCVTALPRCLRQVATHPPLVITELLWLTRGCDLVNPGLKVEPERRRRVLAAKAASWRLPSGRLVYDQVAVRSAAAGSRVRTCCRRQHVQEGAAQAFCNCSVVRLCGACGLVADAAAAAS